MADLIDRQAAIDALKGLPTWWADEGGYYGGAQPPMVALLDPEDAVSAIENLPSTQPEPQHGRIFQEIVVEHPSISTYTEYEGKPYFSIKYTENGQEFIGYGTYKPEVLSGYLKDYFMPSAQPEPLSDAYMKAVWTWLLDYQIKVAELAGRYTPYEVLSWVANDWRKEHEGSD